MNHRDTEGRRERKWLYFLYAFTIFWGGCARLAVEERDLDVEAGTTIKVEFIETAPTDRFIITNTSSCVLEELTLELDLSPSAGMLIFDTSATGAGVDVFQPFEVQEGNIVPLNRSGVADGDTELALRITDLNPGDRAIFTIDVDDTRQNGEFGQSRVTESEISGAIVSITVDDSKATSTFGDESTARVALSECLVAQYSFGY
ncbi:MAG: hypothetical protein AAGA60_15125 [Cyanobacteria bacterium P01_E01_bin.42]